MRHRGRATSAQARALEQLLPRYLFTQPATQPATPPATPPAPPPRLIDANALAEAFGRAAPLAVELGFGNGNALVALAKAKPHWNCIGVDVYQPGFGALVLACAREEITNIRIVDGEATHFLGRLPGASVRQLNVFFPDPWPKKRHHKRRLVNAEFAARAAACLAPDGCLALATDWPGYAEQMRAVLDAEAALHGGVAPRPASRPLTPFEAKAVAAGRHVVDLLYHRASSTNSRCAHG